MDSCSCSIGNCKEGSSCKAPFVLPELLSQVGCPLSGGEFAWVEGQHLCDHGVFCEGLVLLELVRKEEVG